MAGVAGVAAAVVAVVAVAGAVRSWLRCWTEEH